MNYDEIRARAERALRPPEAVNKMQLADDVLALLAENKLLRKVAEENRLLRDVANIIREWSRLGVLWSEVADALAALNAHDKAKGTPNDKS